MSHSEADPHTDKIQQLLFALGKAYLERHEYAQAQEKFRQLLEIGVDNPDVVLNAALSALSLHDLSNSALQLYERAVAANPHSRALLENLSALFVRAEVKTAFADEIIQLAMNVETESMALLPPSDSAQRDVLENLWWQGQFDGALVFLDDNHYSAQAVDLALTFAYQAIAKDETIHDEEKVARILNALEQISPAESLTSLRDYLTLRLSLPEILHETDTHNDDLEEFRFILGLISMEDFFSQLKNGVQRERFILRKFDLKTEILDA
ncbi:MAG TPA: hypothetical protein VGA99_15640, partial [bacterium]